MSSVPTESLHAGSPSRTTSHAASQRSRAHEAVLWFAFVLILAGALLRFHGIDDHGLWADELFSAGAVWFDRAPDAPWFEVKRLPETRLGDSLLTVLAADVHPPLFELVLAPWMRLFGPSELSVRFPGYLASVLLLPILFIGVRRLAGEAAGLLALGSAAFNPGLIFYARDARHYNFLVLFSALATLGALDYWREPRSDSHREIGWRHVGPLLPLSMTHYFGTLLAAVLAAGYLVAALRRRDSGAAPKLGALLALNVAWFAVNLGGLRWGSSGINRWTTYTWPDLVRTLVPSGFELAFPAPVGLAYTAAVAMLAVPAVRRRLRTTGAASRAVGGLVAAYGSVLIMIGAFSIHTGAFNPRFTLHVFVLLHLLGPIALVALLGRRRWLVPAFLTLSIVAWAAWPRGPRPAPREYREASRSIADALRPGDLVVGGNAYQDRYYQFYLSRMIPADSYSFRGADSEDDMRRICDSLASGELHRGAVWVFVPGHDNGLSVAFRNFCGDLYRHDLRREFRGVSIERFVRIAEPTNAGSAIFFDGFEEGSAARWTARATGGLG